MFNIPMTHLAPHAAWSSFLRWPDDPTIGFIVLMGAMLAAALLLIGRRPELSGEGRRGRKPVDRSEGPGPTGLRAH